MSICLPALSILYSTTRYRPVFKPAARSIDSVNTQVEPLPFVPATWITGIGSIPTMAGYGYVFFFVLAFVFTNCLKISQYLPLVLVFQPERRIRAKISANSADISLLVLLYCNNQGRSPVSAIYMTKEQYLRFLRCLKFFSFRIRYFAIEICK